MCSCRWRNRRTLRRTYWIVSLCSSGLRNVVDSWFWLSWTWSNIINQYALGFTGDSHYLKDDRSVKLKIFTYYDLQRHLSYLSYLLYYLSVVRIFTTGKIRTIFRFWTGKVRLASNLKMKGPVFELKYLGRSFDRRSQSTSFRILRYGTQ